MKQLQPSETLPVGLLLALAGGLLDGYSYLNRGQVFATAETGNIVLMGINLAQGQLDQALHYLLPILAFALGVLAAEQLRRRFGDSTRLHWRLPLLLAECGAILLVSCLPCGPLDPLANIIISFTSALQVESFRKFQGCGCVTTMCTGNLRSGTEHLFHWFFHREGTALEKVRCSAACSPLCLPAGPSWPPSSPCCPPSSSCSVGKNVYNPPPSSHPGPILIRKRWAKPPHLRFCPALFSSFPV